MINDVIKKTKKIVDENKIKEKKVYVCRYPYQRYGSSRYLYGGSWSQMGTFWIFEEKDGRDRYIL